MKAYTLKKHKTTGELHIFEGEMTPNHPDHQCKSPSLSICEKMRKTDSTKNIFACATEGQARIKSANIGRSVCGVCVSHLYESY